jgi:acetyl-CoA C-acetyltransferase
MREVVIASGARTAIGKFLGGLAPLKASDLGAIAIKEAMKRGKVEPGEVEEVIFGHVCQGGAGQAPARQSLIKAGIPPAVGAVTINKVCGSGLKAVMMAAQAIKAEDAEIIVAGGQESMSNAPHYLFTGRSGQKFGNQELVDGLIYDGLWCSFNNSHMGILAEYTAECSKIPRFEQDEYAYKSQMKAVAAIKEGRFRNEIVPVEIPQKKGEPIRIDTDESPRADTTLEALTKLKPAFKPDGGTVTAGNAPGMSDGGAALVVMSLDAAKKKGITPLARIVGYATGGEEPKRLFYAPIVAVRKLLDKIGWKIHDFDLIEANEAFSVQSLADGKELGWDWNRVNVNGGAVALGHPIGASGARVLVTLLYAMKDRGAQKGLATLCLGGGNAVAMAVERM